MTTGAWVVGVDVGMRRVSVASSFLTINSDSYYLSDFSVLSYESKAQEHSDVLDEIDMWLDDEWRSLDRFPATAWIEEPPYVNNRRTMLRLATTYGSVMNFFARCGIKVYGVSVNSWKKEAIGNGNASKELVRSVMDDWLPLPILGKLSQDDVDAFGVMRYGVEVSLREWRAANDLYV